MTVNLNFSQNKLASYQFMNCKVKTSYGELVFTGVSKTGFMVSFYNSETSEYEVYEVSEFTVEVFRNFNMYGFMMREEKETFFPAFS